MTRRWIWLVPLSTAAVLTAARALQPFLWITAPTPDAAWWLVSLLLASVVALGGFSLMRSLGVDGALFPVVLAIAATGAGGPLTARTADGPTGAGFGMEALALGLLVWAYDAFVRDRPIRTGVLLGAAGIAHPLVFGHGLVVLLVAALFVKDRDWRGAAQAVLIALAVGAPAVLQLAVGAYDILRMSSIEGRRLIEEGYRFRFPSAYTLYGLAGAAGLSRFVLVVGGFAGTFALTRATRVPAARAMLGLLTGHTALAVLAVLCYTSWLPGSWSRSVTAYALDLTLTSPLLSLLCAVAFLAAVEARLLPALAVSPAGRTNVGHLAALAAVGLAVLGCVGLVWSYRREVRPVSVDREDEELYRWARGTPKRSLFIVPPSARGFRYYTRKGVVVDYDLVPPASPRALRAWRDRLDLVARPDEVARTVAPARRPDAMDRSYALANTPTHAAELLRRFGVNYLVWDTRGLAIPPVAPVERPPDPAVVEAFRNQRYVVYALADSDTAGVRSRPAP